MIRPTALATALAVLLAACSGSGSEGTRATTTASGKATTAASASKADGPEATRFSVVPLPDTVLAARYDNWTADGKGLVFSAVPKGSKRVELYRVALDGSDLACLTCELTRTSDEPLLKALPFSDGKRILVRVGEQSPVTNGDHAVITCTPSVADCTEATMTPIEVPATGDAALQQPQREFRIAPDGVGVAFTQVRTAADGSTAFVPVVGALRLDGDRYVVDHPRVVSTLGELKNFTPDGSHVLLAAFTTLPDRAANPDIIRVDLRTGEQDRITTSPDYDEDISLAPDQQSYVVFSGRGSHLFETVSQVKRPNFIDPGLEGLFGYLFVAHRKELLEPYLVSMGAEQRGQEGQLLNPDSPAEGWDGRTLASWSPDGTAISFWEDKGNPFSAPTADSTRLVVVHLTDREPVDPGTPPTTPEPTWAPALSGFVPPAPELLGSRKGKAGGSVTVTRAPDPAKPGAGTVEVTYRRFDDGDGWVIDGTEGATYQGGLTGRTDYHADLTVSGEHTGNLKADAKISPGGLDGTIESTVDGRTLRLP